ncbi:MAG: signal peptidase I [Verrucomicrobia bacterium]|nr:signal peptidase I [Verrucomicrobiota bacterium]MBU1735889.1 signal peptidase I [Verrucomicrobiota bacterium]MBU1856715.1 signal peptidase I [Verrucomicrobiota bacterium]
MCGGGMVPSLLMTIIWLAFSILMIVAMWKVFVKAGRPGWAVLIPIYNTYVFLKIAGKPGWWLIWFFIPLLNLIFGIIATVAFAQRFGKGAGFTVGLIFLPIIFIPILAFGEAQYVGEGASAPVTTP